MNPHRRSQTLLAPRLAAGVLSALTLLPLGIFSAAPALAELASPVLVQDFAPGLTPSSVRPQDFATIDGRLYFAGQDAASGSELWVSDGSAASTRRLADLCPGYCWSSPRAFTQLDGAILFHGFASNGLSVLYRLEGEEAQELLRVDEQIGGWARLGSAVYFTTHTKLYRSDGTREGTVAILEFEELPVHSGPRDIGVVTDSLGEALYFADAGHLYRMAAGAAPVAIAELSGASAFTTFTSGRFVFRGCTTSFEDCHAYVSNGTGAGTRQLEMQPGDTLTLQADHFLLWQGRIYFETNDAVAPYRHIASTDGTAAGTRRESPTGNQLSGSYLLAATASHLYHLRFMADGSRGSLLVRNSGGTDQTLATGQDAYQLIGELNGRVFIHYRTFGGSQPPTPGTEAFISSGGELASTVTLATVDAQPGGAVLGDKLYFSGNSGLWQSNGTAAGTVELALGLTTAASSSPRSYPFRGKLVVQTTDFSTAESTDHLHQVDPASLAHQLVDSAPLQVKAAGANKMLLASSDDPDARLFGYDGTSLSELPVVGLSGEAGGGGADDHFFFFTDVAPAQALWETDGTAAGTVKRLEFSPSTDCSVIFCGNLGELAVSPSQVYFFAGRDGSPDHPPLSVWDRVLGEKRVLVDGIWLFPFPTVLADGRALLVRPRPEHFGYDLWLSNGTAAGTQAYFVAPAGFRLYNWAVAGARLFLVLESLADGRQALWINNFATGATSDVLAPAEVDFTRLVAAGDNVYFVADHGNGKELGFSDGTAAGTRFLDLRPGPEGSMPADFFVLADGRLVFAAAGDEAGYELWISNGQASGSYRLTDLNPGEAPSSPKNITQAGNRLFFAATDGLRGEELWALDLPAGYGPCPAGSSCVLGNRFEVRVVAHTADGDFVGKRAAGTAESGVFTFFSENNWEMLVKVLDGCGINQKHWVFGAAATDAAFTLTVTDRETGAEKVYDNPSGQAARAITDTAAFSCN